MLRNLAEGCNFEALEKSLRDTFVIGLRNGTAKAALIRTTKVKFEEIVSEAQAIEMSESSVGKHQGTSINWFSGDKKKLRENKARGKP